MLMRLAEARKHSGERERGFTLIEIMVAALLLLIMAAAFVPLFLTGLSQSSSARNRSLASNIARERMEQIRQLDYREIQEDTANPTDPMNLSARFGTSTTIRDIAFSIGYSVNPVSYGSGTLKEVTVTVNWDPPPASSPAIITSLIHQQFVGPRGSKLVFTPSYNDPAGSPFGLLLGTTTATYDVAEADWQLVFTNLDQVGMAKKNVYMRLFLVDDLGTSYALGPAEQDYKIDNASLYYTLDGSGKVNRVYFSHQFNASDIPDGYWNAKAVLYNEYDEPGNVWTLRVRIENGAPAAVTGFSAEGQPDNESVFLQWTPGQERDRANWVIRRDFWLVEESMWAEAWTTLTDSLNPNTYSFLDHGDLVGGVPPYGTLEAPQLYRYQIWAVDIAGLEGPAVSAEAELPNTTPIDTTTTTAAGSTTSTTAGTTTTRPPTVNVQNSTSRQWSIVIRDSSGATVQTGTVKNGKTWTSAPLVPGNYAVTATSGSTARPASFNIPLQSGTTVLVITF
jgi:prepilin-type N-terminal cleavage/methylation domain-containing protein